MDVRDAFYHGIIHQLRRVLGAMTEDEIDAGIDAFETGSSDWNNCFFARALANRPEFRAHRNEVGVAKALGLAQANGMPNLVPVRMVYFTFDSHSTFLTRKALKQFITDIRDERRPAEVMQILKSINYTDAESKEIPESAFCT